QRLARLSPQVRVELRPVIERACRDLRRETSTGTRKTVCLSMARNLMNAADQEERMRKVHVVSAISLLTMSAATALAETPAPQPPLSPAGTFIGGASVDGRLHGGYIIDGNDPQLLPPPDVNDGTMYHAPIIFYV